MKWSTSLRDIPTRLATGAFVLHSGLEKWSGGKEQAQGVHGMAAGAYPFLESVPPQQFLKALSASEIAIGSLLLLPVVSNRTAGAALTGFAGGLVTMYLRTPVLRKPDSIWPSQAGIGVSKDVWMLGIGVGLVLDRRRSRAARVD